MFVYLRDLSPNNLSWFEMTRCQRSNFLTYGSWNVPGKLFVLRNVLCFLLGLKCTAYHWSVMREINFTSLYLNSIKFIAFCSFYPLNISKTVLSSINTWNIKALHDRVVFQPVRTSIFAAQIPTYQLTAACRPHSPHGHTNTHLHAYIRQVT